ncbi:MAG: LPS export ABC transporter periplasmic protein LptC [Bacteroidales bacterium]
MRYSKQKYSFALKSIVMGLALTMLFGCKNKLSEVYGDVEELSLPDIQYYDAVFQQTDSGILQAKIIAPKADRYLGDSGKIVLPQRFDIYFYEKDGLAKGKLSADYGLQEDDSDKTEAQGNVVLISFEDSTKLYTERLIWDKKKRRIFSPVDVKVVTPDQVAYGDSLEASDDLKDREIFGFKSEIEFEEQKNDSTQVAE